MKIYKYILFIIIALTFSIIANAQVLKVESFERINDISATSKPRTDANGNKCALIKVSLPVEGCKFTGNIVGDPIFDTNEYWVYMTSTSKYLEIRCPGCNTLVAELGKTGVEAAITYRLELSGYPNATGNSKEQLVTFKITPPDAILTIDQKEYATTNGVAQLMLSPTEHTYMVVAPGYNGQGSKFMVYENNTNKIIVELEPKAHVASNAQATQTNLNTSAPINTNTINGHEYVDLGLPSGTKWATCNVGASSPSEYGDYFAWGEITPKSEYTEANSKTYGKSIGDISGNPQYDAARAKWGGSWRLPTKTELEELKDKCIWTWITQGGHIGYNVTGPNGNSIFLPTAGCREGSSFSLGGSGGNYWGSTPFEGNAKDSCFLHFGSNRHGVSWHSRYDGRSVRPVSE